MKNKFYLFCLIIPVLFSACSTDLDVTGKYKETMVVYGLLDQGKPKQYIKINKAFLGQGSALVMAQVKDSVQYTNALSVTIKRLSDGSLYNLSPDNSIPKDPGAFYGPDQANAIYSFNTPLVPDGSTSNPNDSTNSILVSGSEYRLTIKNNITGTEVSSQTVLVNDFAYTQYVSSSTYTFYNASSPAFPFVPKWNSAKNGRLYQLTIRFNYFDSTATGNIPHHLDWVFPQQTSQGLNGGESMGENFPGQEFFQFVGSQLNNDPSVQSSQTSVIRRIAGNVDLIVAVGSDDLNTFIDVSKPSTGIIQDKPEFSNITNGIGLFSSRYNKFPEGPAGSNSMSKPLSAASLIFLRTGSYTNNLKFIR